MSGFAKIWAWEQRGLSPTEKCVLIGLADFHTENGGCFPSLKRVAELVNVSIDTVHRTIDKLIEKGLVRKHSRQKEDGGKNSNLYDLLFTDIKAPYPQNADTPTRKMRHEQQDLEQDTTPTELEDPLISIFDVPEEPPVENSKAFWDQAVGMLTALGVAKATVNPFIGRCLKMTGQDQDKVLEAIQAAVDSEPSNAVPYIVAILGGKKNKKTAKQKEIDDAFAQLHEASERRKARWKEQYGTEYGVLPDTGTGGGEDLQLLQPEPHQGHSVAVADSSSGSGAVPRRSPASVIRPRKGYLSEGEVSADDF